MTTFPPIPGLDGLITLSRREGVDIRPTLLRVLTDLYVQTPSHTPDEEQHFVALTSRLIDEVDDATRAAVHARLSIYPRTPRAIMDKLTAPPPAAPAWTIPQARRDETGDLQEAPALAMQPSEASELNEMFFRAGAAERLQILRSLEEAPLKAAPRIDARRAARAVTALDQMAREADLIGVTAELTEVLVLPSRLAQRIVEDQGGEPLACALKAIDMPSEAFQRVLLFLDPELGASVTRVYTLARLYDKLSERMALVMLAAWRGTSLAGRAKHRPMLYDDERQRARATAQPRATVQPASTPLPSRQPTRG
ncbi:DUF2336 domain-containing protein [Bradyrhizobium sp. 2TAF24]|uniref:DUF2336 domain-containing protein n=1 Tax=Bradyrhizobium sp. 2TAF24 TaxID=3233011 RepID=UPI003F8E0F96